MIELTENNLISIDNNSSKGNQLKWKAGNIWYKADYAGYEGLSEILASKMLQNSSLQEGEYVLYESELIKYKKNQFGGCKSNDFLKEGQQLITLERLFNNFFGESLYRKVFAIGESELRFEFIVSQIERITGLKNFASYINKIVTIDALTLNEDRHMHNIAVILNKNGSYELCPIFDQGAGLLSDTTLDYPMDGDIYELIDSVKAKTFSSSFDEQLEVSEKYSGMNLTFHFTKSDVRMWLDEEKQKGVYSDDVLNRVEKVMYDRMRAYQYLFV